MGRPLIHPRAETVIVRCRRCRWHRIQAADEELGRCGWCGCRRHLVVGRWHWPTLKEAGC